MNGRALFIVDAGATVGGIAQGITDLSVLGGGEVDLRRVDFSRPDSATGCVAELRGDGPSVVAVGLADSTTRIPADLMSTLAVPGRPLVYVNVGSKPEGQPLLSSRRRILSHVVVAGDFSVRSGCLAACLRRVCGQGVGAVTLLHLGHHSAGRACEDSTMTQLRHLDVDWCEWLKSRLFRSGVSEVRIVVPGQSEPDAWKDVGSGASLIVVGSTCDDHVVRGYLESWRSMKGDDGLAPALMFTAEGCSAAVSAGAA